jgi:hypothetical protein
MKNSGALFTFLMEIGAMVKKEPGGRQVAAGHGVLQGRPLPYTYRACTEQNEQISDPSIGS